MLDNKEYPFSKDLVHKIKVFMKKSIELEKKIMNKGKIINSTDSKKGVKCLSPLITIKWFCLS
eukprot:snap_masked-scaffold_79-processed-gene-0.14-mRNA-1 protein AED:1.00 eAED:1.00 QI:0/-1/0/0/-1/1/1/0/62